MIAVALWWRPWPHFELVLVLPTFLAGTAVWAVYRRRPPGRVSAPGRYLPTGLVAAGVAACFLPWPGVANLALLCGFVGLFAGLARAGDDCHAVWRWRPAVFLGEVSYSLYMTHAVAQKVLYAVLPSTRFEAAGLGARLAVALAYALLIAACCLVTYFVVERPCRLYFKRLTAGARGRAADPARPGP
jgi:peptidoglycan/LPS O-acetylase OafA/YrhL